MIEIYATDFIHLVDKNHRERFLKNPSNIAEQFRFMYWQAGATELATGKKTLTLEQFEQKYSMQLIELGEKNEKRNLYFQYRMLEHQDIDVSELKMALRELDSQVNVNWPLSHFKSAVRYLQRDPEDIKATGGTNWQKYLPPRFQKRIFYPGLWTEDEINNWGKAWVESALG
jgi:tryptophan 2,3-dioxygenase